MGKVVITDLFYDSLYRIIEMKLLNSLSGGQKSLEDKLNLG